MDSKDVNKALAKKIKPMLKAAGFDSSTARYFRRYRNDRIEVINFQSFNSHLAAGLGCTTFSFALNLGIYFLCVPNNFIKQSNGVLQPAEYDCHFRGGILRTIELDKPIQHGVFFVTADGLNLDDMVNDACAGLQKNALPWFEKYLDMNVVLTTLIESDENLEDTWGWGRKTSPLQYYYTGFVAKSLQKWDIAANALKHVIDSGVIKKSHTDHAYAEVLSARDGASGKP